MLDAEEHAFCQHVKGVVPVGDACLGERPDGSANTGIVKDNVQTSESGSRQLKHCDYICLGRDISFDEGGAVAVTIVDRRRQCRLAGLLVEISNDYRGTFGQKALHGRQPHSTRTASDDGDLSLQSH